MKKRIFTMILALILLLAGTIQISADDWVINYPFQITFKDENKVFYYNPDEEEDYPATGLYHPTDPLEVIYFVKDIYPWVFMEDFFFSKDLQYFVLIPTIEQDSSLSFYSNGVLLKCYTIDDLVRNLKAVSYTTSTARWLDRSSIELNSEYNTLTLTTVDHLTYVFDITTGTILEAPAENQVDHLSYVSDITTGTILEAPAENQIVRYLFLFVISGISIIGLAFLLAKHNRPK